jgi:cytochrome c5
MSRRNLVVLTLIIIAVAWAACSYKKEALAYPSSSSVSCDTSNVRYSVEVVGVLSANCYTCHAASVANVSGGGTVLDNYNRVKLYASTGYLLNVILHTPGYDQMPNNGGMLGSCDIAKIRTWIRIGMPNN